MDKPVSSMRVSYELASLDEHDVDRDPIAQFSSWFAEIVEAAGIIEANAMTLSTVDAHGYPSSRVVLMKQFDGRGFVFFTNYDSEKGRDIADNPHVAVLFYWPSHQRQVRICGRAERVATEESDAYFVTRPWGSQIGAVVSPQSEPVPGRAWLEARYAEAETARPEGSTIARPRHWGGYRVVPDTVEFWQGRPNRLHDRILYTRSADDSWDIARLAP
jgi:pyridoxamine 5'-phosphate oxidase